MTPEGKTSIFAWFPRVFHCSVSQVDAFNSGMAKRSAEEDAWTVSDGPRHEDSLYRDIRPIIQPYLVGGLEHFL